MIGLLGGVGARGTVLIYNLVIANATYAQQDSDYPNIMVYNMPMKSSSVTCEPSLALLEETVAGLKALQRAGCTTMYIACNSMQVLMRDHRHIFESEGLYVNDFAAEFMGRRHQAVGAKGEHPRILCSETTASFNLYPHTRYDASLQAEVNALISNIIRRPPSGEDQRRFLELLDDETLIACTELSVIWWSLPREIRANYYVEDTAQFLAQRINEVALGQP